MQGVCAEACAKNMGISREEQDEYAIQSYQRSQSAAERGAFHQEIVPVTVPQKKGRTLNVFHAGKFNCCLHLFIATDDIAEYCN